MSEREIDQALVEQVQQGDREAFDILVLKYQTRVAVLVSRFIDDHSAVLDVTQETFIKAYRAIKSFKGNSAFYTWIYRIAINTAKNYAKVKTRRPPDTDIDFGDAESQLSRVRLKETATPERLLMCDEVQDAVLSAVNTLPEELRTSILLREMAGLSYDEIAAMMDCPVGTVRSRIFRARSVVDERLKPLIDSN